MTQTIRLHNGHTTWSDGHFHTRLQLATHAQLPQTNYTDNGFTLHPLPRGAWLSASPNDGEAPPAPLNTPHTWRPDERQLHLNVHTHQDRPPTYSLIITRTQAQTRAIAQQQLRTQLTPLELTLTRVASGDVTLWLLQYQQAPQTWSAPELLDLKDTHTFFLQRSALRAIAITLGDQLINAYWLRPHPHHAIPEPQLSALAQRFREQAHEPLSPLHRELRARLHDLERRLDPQLRQLAAHHAPTTDWVKAAAIVDLCASGALSTAHHNQLLNDIYNDQARQDSHAHLEALAPTLDYALRNSHTREQKTRLLQKYGEPGFDDAVNAAKELIERGARPQEALALYLDPSPLSPQHLRDTLRELKSTHPLAPLSASDLLTLADELQRDLAADADPLAPTPRLSNTREQERLSDLTALKAALTALQTELYALPFHSLKTHLRAPLLLEHATFSRPKAPFNPTALLSALSALAALADRAPALRARLEAEGLGEGFAQTLRYTAAHLSALTTLEQNLARALRLDARRLEALNALHETLSAHPPLLEELERLSREDAHRDWAARCAKIERQRALLNTLMQPAPEHLQTPLPTLPIPTQQALGEEIQPPLAPFLKYAMHMRSIDQQTSRALERIKQEDEHVQRSIANHLKANRPFCPVCGALSSDDLRRPPCECGWRFPVALPDLSAQGRAAALSAARVTRDDLRRRRFAEVARAALAQTP